MKLKLRKPPTQPGLHRTPIAGVCKATGIKIREPKSKISKKRQNQIVKVVRAVVAARSI